MIRFATDLALGRPIDVHRGAERSWLHISDAVRAIEAAVQFKDYAVINLGHPDVVPIEQLAEAIRIELDASPSLVRVREIPGQMTLRKRPVLNRMRDLLGVTPRVSLDEGVRLVCAKVAARVHAGERPW
jgi:nucleoside-diphosphate-sugar epimerase